MARRSNAETAGRLACVAVLIVSVASVGRAVAAPAADKPYTVAEFPVDATAKDAVAAKEKAHAEGTRDAFRALLKRVVPVTAYTRLTRLKNANAADLVTGIKVRSEQHSSTEYIASLDYTFDAGGVRALLKREGVPYIDTQAPSVSLVPASVETGGDGQSARGVALWAESWAALDGENTVAPFSIEKKPDLDAESVAKLATGESDLFVGSKPVVAAVAEIDHAAQKVTVTLVGHDAVGPIDLKRSYRIGREDLAYTLELAAVVALGTLEGRWKAVNATARGGVDAISGPGVPVRIEVIFSSQGEWNDMRQRLLDTPGVDDVRVDAVSARSADVSLLFPGGARQLSDTLASRGLSLRQEGGAWSLRASF